MVVVIVEIVCFVRGAPWISGGCHPTDPLIFRHRNKEVVLSSLPTAVWPDQFPVSSFQNLIKYHLDEVETPIEVDAGATRMNCSDRPGFG